MMLFTDPERTPRPWDIAARMPAGSGVVYRTFGAADALEVALRLRAVTRDRGMVLLIGADADLADTVEADGLHLPERAVSQADSLSRQAPGWILTGTAHAVDAALAARRLDAVVLSPIFAAGGASAGRQALGLLALGQVAAGATRVIGLGGITSENATLLTQSGAHGLAAIDGIARAFGP
jgi:thiamine-phosphate pyrophosphorylase